MRIVVGTDNKLKVVAVEEVIREYKLFPEAEVVGIDIRSGVSEQPVTLEEIRTGAHNRAVRSFAYGAFALGVGIESGLFPEPFALSGMLDICVCVIFDGNKTRLGYSFAFEFPKDLVDVTLKEKVTVRQAGIKLGYTNNLNIAHEEGFLGMLTNRRLTRSTQIKQAVETALISFVHPEFYR